MPLSIKDPETDRLARALADATGESLTEAIRIALTERLERQTAARTYPLVTAVKRIQERLQRLPVINAQSADDIIGYDSHGVPE